MTLEQKMSAPGRPKVAPVEYAGQWVAWDKDETKIVAHGTNLADVRAAADAAGELDPVFERVHRPDRFRV